MTKQLLSCVFSLFYCLPLLNAGQQAIVKYQNTLESTDFAEECMRLTEHQNTQKSFKRSVHSAFDACVVASLKDDSKNNQAIELLKEGLEKGDQPLISSSVLSYLLNSLLLSTTAFNEWTSSFDYASLLFTLNIDEENDLNNVHFLILKNQIIHNLFILLVKNNYSSACYVELVGALLAIDTHAVNHFLTRTENSFLSAQVEKILLAFIRALETEALKKCTFFPIEPLLNKKRKMHSPTLPAKTAKKRK